MCNHPFDALQFSGFVAVRPFRTEAITQNRPVRIKDVMYCTACKTVIVLEGGRWNISKQAEQKPPQPAVHKCACGVLLTQPYAIERGECVSCTLARIRKGRGERVFLVSNVARERDRKRLQRAGAKA